MPAEFRNRLYRTAVGVVLGLLLGSGTGMVGGVFGAVAGSTIFIVFLGCVGFLLKWDTSPMPWTDRESR